MEMIKKLLSPKVRPFVIAGIAAFILVLLINAYLKQQAEMTRRKIEERERTIGVVLMAKEDISPGREIKENMVEEVRMPIRFIQPKAVDSISRIEGLVTVVPILKGEQILLTKLSRPGEIGSLSMKTPPGKRAISIVVDNISALAGLIRPGDHVDVIGVVPVPMPTADGKQTVQLTTMPLFQDVLVLAVGTKLEREAAVAKAKKGEKAKAAPAPTASSVITLALDPQEANLIAFIQEQQGKIRLTLRSPTDAATPTLSPGSWETLIQYVYPQLMQNIMQKTQPQEEQQKIEIYRGTEKEIK